METERMRRLVFVSLLGLSFMTVSGFSDDSRDTTSPFGVLEFFSWNHEYNGFHYQGDQVEQGIKLMAECGIGIVRLDFLWADIEPQKNVFDFSKYDGIVDQLLANGIKVQGILLYNPTWDGDPWNKAPNEEAFLSFAQQTVRHFRSRVKYWEIWNEPDSLTYWTPQDGLVAYSRLLRRSSQVIRKEDPTAKILNGGFTSSIPFQLKKLYKQAGKESFDIVNIHPFSDPFGSSGLAPVRGIVDHVTKVMQEFDDRKPIWFTEIGCPGWKTGDPRRGWWFGKSPNEDEQSRYLKQVFDETLTWPGVEKVFWAFFRDTNNFFKNGVDGFGLVRNDFSTKPSYRAYQDIIHRSKSGHLTDSESR